MSKPYLTVEKDSVAEINRVIKSFKRDNVLVGIPAGTEREEVGSIGNASLLFINNFGSPGQNIPPRPVMQIGIFNAQEAIADEYGSALKAALNKGVSSLPRYYNRIGMLASNSIKNAINAGIGFPGPSDATKASRKAAGFNGTKSLIRTGQMRNAITWVVPD